jgi:hypothetical protein
MVAKQLLTRLQSVDSAEGRQRAAAYLRSQPFPHDEPAPGAEGLLLQIEANGRRTVERFVNRCFQPENRGGEEAS